MAAFGTVPVARRAVLRAAVALAPALFLATAFAPPAGAQVDLDMIRRVQQVRNPAAAVAADFDEDGRVDVAVVTGGDRVQLLRNDGRHAFEPSTVLPHSDDVTALATADVDLDGHADLVAGVEATIDEIVVHYGIGDGTFAPAVVHELDVIVLDRIAIGDVDGDGFGDLVVVDRLRGDLVMLLSDGPRSFAEPRLVHLGCDIADVAIGDAIGGPEPDLLYSSRDSAHVGVLAGLGAGAFASETLRWYGAFDPRRRSIVADLDGNGTPDVAGTAFRQLVVHFGDGLGGFTDAIVFDTADAAEHLTHADFDGDGSPDLFVTHPDRGEVSMHFGNAGAFDDRITVSLPGATYPVAADFDGDGNADLAITRGGGSDRISVFLGNGSGGFAAPLGSPAGDDPEQATPADFDGDGTLDLAVIDATRVLVLEGDGTGRFGAPLAIAEGSGPVFVAAADVVEDGSPDLVVLHELGDGVTIYAGDGAFGFAPVATITLESVEERGEVAIADFDGDGHLDFAVGERPLADGGGADDSGAVRVFLGDGTGSFAEAPPIVSTSRTGSLAARDLDADGRVDLVVGNRDPSSHLVLPGHGDGTFGRSPRYRTAPDTSEMARADLDGDGHLDLAVGGREIAILLADPAGGFAPSPERYDALVGHRFPTAADFDGDGILDLAAASDSTIEQGLAVFLGDGNGRFPDARSERLSSAPIGSMLVDDFTNDGEVDVAWPYPFQNRFSVAPGDGEGWFRLGVANPFSGELGGITSADLDGDGVPDLIATTVAGTAEVALGIGDGTFATGAPGEPVGSGPASIAVGDFDEDGNLDVATANTVANTVSVLTGDGAGGFSSRIDVPVARGPLSISAADFDQDGNVDIAVLSNLDAAIDVLFGDGLGTFPTAVRVPGLGRPEEMVAGNFDPLLDPEGYPDFLVRDPGIDGVRLVRNDGDRTFSFGAAFELFGEEDQSLAVADFDRDGRLDVAIGYEDSLRIEYRLNSGFGTFPPSSRIVRLTHASGRVMPGDLNGDGRTDLVAVSDNYREISIALGDGEGAFPIVRGFHPRFTSWTLAMTVDADGDGLDDLLMAGLFFHDVTFHRNRTLDPDQCLAGNANEAGGGRRVDQLRVNGSIGTATRELAVDSTDAIEIALEAAPEPAAGDKYYAAVWPGRPDASTAVLLPKRIGLGCFTPVRPDPAYVAPLHVANTLRPSDPRVDPPGPTATGLPLPAIVIAIPSGTFSPGTDLTVQAITGDGNAVANTSASLTNAVIVRIE